MGARTASFLLLPLYTSYVTPAEWGILSLLWVTGDFASLMLSCQVNQAVFRSWALTDCEEQRRRLIGLSLATQIVVSTVAFLPVYLWAGAFEELLGTTGFTSTIRVYAFTLQLALALDVVQADMRLRNEARLYASLDMGQNLTQAACNVVFLAVIGWGIRGMILGQFLTFLLAVGIFLPRSVRRMRINLDLRTLRSLLSFSLPLVPSAVAMAAMHNLDRYFLKAYMGSAEVGLYSMGYKLGTIVSILILGPFLLFWEPHRYEVARHPDAPRKLGAVFSYFLATLLFVAVGLIGATPEIVRVMTHPRYWQCETVVPLVVLAYVLFGLDNVVRVSLLYRHKTKTVLAVVLLATTVNLIANALLIPHHGMLGAAWATVFAFAVLFLCDLVMGLRQLPIVWEWGKLARLVTVSCCILGGMLSVTGLETWTSVCLKLALLALFPLLLIAGGFFRGVEWRRMLGREAG